MQEQTASQATYDGSKLILAKDLSATGLYEGTLRTGMILQDTASPVAAANFTISGLSANIHYVLVMYLTQNTSTGGNNFIFNADGGANYTRQHYGAYATTLNAFRAAGSTALYTYFYGQAAGSYQNIVLDFYGNGNNTYVRIFNDYVDNGTGAGLTIFRGTGIYAGAAALSSITIATSAGTMTGTAKLYKLN
jgi:hypothetical protein